MRLRLLVSLCALSTTACGGRSGLEVDSLGFGGAGTLTPLGSAGAASLGSSFGAGGASSESADASVGTGGALVILPSDAATSPQDAAAARDSGARDGPPDATPGCDPEVVSVTPAPDAVEIPTTTTISVVLGCEAGAPTSPDVTLILSTGGRAVDGDAHVSVDGASIAFVPAHGLSLSTTYVAEVRRASDSLRTWTFTTREGTWHDAETVAQIAALDQDFVFAVNDDGAGIIAYSGSGGTSVSARRFDVASGLSPDTEAVAQRSDGVQEVMAGIDANRRAAIAWREYSLYQAQPGGPSGGQYNVFATTESDGGAWSSLETVDGPARDSIPELLQLGAGPSGRELLLLNDAPHGTRQGIDVELGDLDDVAGGPLIAAENVGGDSSQFGFEPGGAAWVVWDANSYGSWSVGVRRLSSSNVWGDSYDLGSASGSGARLAVAVDGSVLVVFPAKVSGLYTLAARRFIPGSGWSDAQTLDTQGDIGTTYVSGAYLALDSAGNGLALWTTSMSYVVSQSGGLTTYGSRSETRSQRFTPNGGWASAHDTLDFALQPSGLLPGSYGGRSEQALALDDAGNGFAVGVLDTGEVRAARFRASSGWQPSVQLGQVPSQGSNMAAAPRITVTRNGSAVALWRSGYNLVMRRFGE